MEDFENSDGEGRNFMPKLASSLVHPAPTAVLTMNNAKC
jgi:hypothetical protein